MAKKTSKKEQKHGEPPIWEWIIAATGAILVFVAIGFLVYEAITGESAPPSLSVSVESVAAVDNGWLVKFRVKNTGDQTAADVNIEGELKNGEQTVETSAATLTYAPSHSEREGGLIFSKNPNQYQLEVRPKGYEKP